MNFICVFLIEEILKHPKDLLQYFNWNSIELLVIKQKQKCLCMYNNDYKIIFINRIGISKTQVSSSDKNILCIELHHIQHYCADERKRAHISVPICLSKLLGAANWLFGWLKQLGKTNWDWYTSSLSLVSTVMLDVCGIR